MKPNKKNINDNDASTERLVPVSKWEKLHTWPNEAGLRYLIFNEDKNNFSKVIRRVGRRVLIHERSFFEWVEEQNNPTTHRQEPNAPRPK